MRVLSGSRRQGLEIGRVTVRAIETQAEER